VAKTKSRKFPLNILAVALRLIGRLLSVVFAPLRPVTRPAVRYLRGVRAEFKNVTWPTRAEAIRITLAVVLFSVAFTVFVMGADYGIEKAFAKLIAGSTK
jgi:preprotein translocase SecE subunit